MKIMNNNDNDEIMNENILIMIIMCNNVMKWKY